MRTRLTAVLTAAVLLTAGCSSSSPPADDEGAEFELESSDCDMEDALNRESDCTSAQIAAAIAAAAAAKKAKSARDKAKKTVKTERKKVCTGTGAKRKCS